MMECKGEANYTLPPAENPNEHSTLIIPVTFLDDEQEPVEPKSAHWKLLDDRGNVVVGRDVSPLADSIEIVLKGAELSMAGGSGLRYLLIEYIFDSTAGTDLPANWSIQFTIQNVPGIS